MSPLHAAVANRRVERQRHRCRGRVPLLGEGHDHLVHRHAELAGRRLDDSNVRLVGNQPVDVRLLHPVGGQRLVDDPVQRAHRDLEDFVALHLRVRSALRDASRAARGAAVDIEERLVAAVRVQVRRHHARRLRRFEHHRSGAVAEQHARRAIGPVEQPGMRVGADHQRAADAAGAKELLGDSQGIDEARAHRLHVERGAPARTEARLQAAGGRRVDAVRGRRAHDDEVQRRRIDLGRLERAARCALGEVAGGFRLVDDVALADAGAFPYPRIAGLHAPREFGVGDDAVRKARSGAGDSRIDHTASFSTSTDAMCSLMRSGTFFLISATASTIARRKATTSALPWLLITIPRSPRKLAPL